MVVYVMNEKIIIISGKIFSFINKGIILILPLFFLPWTSLGLGMDNFNKQNLLWLIVPVAFCLFLFKLYSAGEIKLRISYLDLAILFFVLIYSLATIFSLDVFSSLFGYYSALGLPLLTLLSLVLFYFLIKNFVSSVEDIIKIISLWLISYIALIIFSLVLFWGYGTEYFRLAAGSLFDFALYLAVVDILVLGLITNKNLLALVFKKRWQSYILKTAFVISLILLVLINYSLSWAGFLFAIILIYIFKLVLYKKTVEAVKFNSSNWLRRLLAFSRQQFWPIFILILSLLMLVLNHYSPATIKSRLLAQSLILDSTDTFNVAHQALATRSLLGYGPETFGYVFSLQREPSLNYSEYWNLRFNRASSFITDLSLSTGWLGILSYGFFIFWLIFLLVKFLLHAKKHTTISDANNNLFIGLIGFTLTLLFLQCIYPANTILLMLFWLALGLISAYLYLAEPRTASVTSKITNGDLTINKSGKGFSIFLIIIFFLFAGWVALVSLGIKFWLAEFYYEQGQAPIERMVRAAKLNPYRYNYQVTLAKKYLQSALEQASKIGGNDVNVITNLMQQSINWGKSAVRQALFAVTTEETLGAIYREISPYVADAQVQSIAAFREAIKLEPSNPVLYTELGKAYLTNKQYNEAIIALAKARDLKEDYYEASYELGQANLEQGDWDKALEFIQSLVGKYNDEAINFTLGQIYFNKKNFGEAIKYFNNVLTVTPNNVNALYGLGLALEASGEKEQALYNFNKVFKLNPTSKELTDKVAALEKEIKKKK